jgi:hypothetical protein
MKLQRFPAQCTVEENRFVTLRIHRRTCVRHVVIESLPTEKGRMSATFSKDDINDIQWLNDPLNLTQPGRGGGREEAALTWFATCAITGYSRWIGLNRLPGLERFGWVIHLIPAEVIGKILLYLSISTCRTAWAIKASTRWRTLTVVDPHCLAEMPFRVPAVSRAILL